jgi:hypothetical protein
MIPNIIHFVFGLKDDFGGKPFSLIHYLAVKSAYDCNRPDAIKFHYRHEPEGEWWEKARPYLTLVRTEPPTEIFGNPLLHVAHQADVMRLELLLREGGIYLDMDVLCINSLAPLLRHHCVIGREGKSDLCNAVMLAEPNAEFLRLWHGEYRTFRARGRDEFWDEHACKVPFRLAREHPGLVRIEDEFSFFWPLHTGASPAILWSRYAEGFPARLMLRSKQLLALLFLKGSYCVHLWEQLWWEPYLRRLTPESLAAEYHNFSKLFAGHLDGAHPVSRHHRLARLLRPLVKIMVRCGAKP